MEGSLPLQENSRLLLLAILLTSVDAYTASKERNIGWCSFMKHRPDVDNGIIVTYISSVGVKKILKRKLPSLNKILA